MVIPRRRFEGDFQRKLLDATSQSSRINSIKSVGHDRLSPRTREPAGAHRCCDHRLSWLRSYLCATAACARRRPSRAPRVTYLDGIRGVAAFLVLIHHLAIVFFPGAIFGPSMPSRPAAEYLFYATPFLDLPIQGNFMVCIFYALSGMALAYKPLSLSVGKRWESVVSGVARRYPRLMIPALVANLLTWAVLLGYARLGARITALAATNTSWFPLWVKTAPSRHVAAMSPHWVAW
ncbi:MAG TPA: acyltransferase [Ktedonobacterales bacterium]|nr:acyltransferase [Ktedonobacterales bacterium]